MSVVQWCMFWQLFENMYQRQSEALRSVSFSLSRLISNLKIQGENKFLIFKFLRILDYVFNG